MRRSGRYSTRLIIGGENQIIYKRPEIQYISLMCSICVPRTSHRTFSSSVMRFTSGRCTSNARLDGKTAVVTGSNTGIGKVTVKDFFMRGKSKQLKSHNFFIINTPGAKVIMACRNIEKAEAAAKDIREQCTNEPNTGQIVVTQLDLMSLNSVRNCAQHLLQSEERINLLINNAGVMMCPEGKTEDGFEIQFGTNHLGHFLLTMLLLPKIIKSAPSRIVNVSSLAHTCNIIIYTLISTIILQLFLYS